MSKKLDLTGQLFGRLTVIKEGGRSKGGSVLWLCQCSCVDNNKVIVSGPKLKSGHTKSCGCLRREFRRLAPGEAALNHLLAVYKTGAKNCGRSFEITREEFAELTKQDCFYCGQPPSQEVSRECFYGKYTYNGLDRVNNLKDYTVDNVVPCCKHCNRAKYQMSQEEFLAWISKAAKHQNLRKELQ